MSPRSIVVISAGLSVPSSTRLLGDQLAEATAAALAARGEEADLQVVELRDHAHDITNALLTGFPSGGLRAVTDRVRDADGLVVVSPIFNASYSGLFKSFFDALEEGTLLGTPVLLAATGGTARHSLALEHALRPLFSYLRAVTVPTAVYAASEDWGSVGAAAAPLRTRVERAAAELARLVAGGAPPARPDPFADPPSFEELLAAGG